MKIRKNMVKEWVGPRCFKPGIKMSTSDMTEAKNSRGRFTFTFKSLDDAFPVMYPKARCPTANVELSSEIVFKFRLRAYLGLF